MLGDKFKINLESSNSFIEKLENYTNHLDDYIQRVEKSQKGLTESWESSASKAGMAGTDSTSETFANSFDPALGGGEGLAELGATIVKSCAKVHDLLIASAINHEVANGLAMIRI